MWARRDNPITLNAKRTRSIPNVFTLFKAWEGLQGDDPQTALRASIARGQTL